MILTLPQTVVKHTSALSKMERCKITVSEDIYLKLGKSTVPQEWMLGVRNHRKYWNISEASKQSEQRTRGWFVVSVWESVQPFSVEFKVPWFQSPSAIFYHWVAPRCSVSTQSAFLPDNQQEDSDNLFRLKPGMANTCLIRFAKVTEESSGTTW